MRDVELFEAILGFTTPSEVVSVELNLKSQEVTVKVDAGLVRFSVRGFRRWSPATTAGGIWIPADS